MSTADTREAWRKIAERYRQLSAVCKPENLGGRLACLVLADYCLSMWSEDRGGPSLEMVALAEHIVGDRIDEIVAAELKKITTLRDEQESQRLS